MATLSFRAAGAQTAFSEYWQAVAAADERVARLTTALKQSVAGWRFGPVLLALQALRGIDQISAIGLWPRSATSNASRTRVTDGVPGLGTFAIVDRRARGPRQHHQDRECACAPAADRGSVELPPFDRALVPVRSAVPKRPLAIRDVAWNAPLPLSGRFRRLRARGVHRNKVCTAVARELAGFVWAIAWTRAKLA